MIPIPKINPEPCASDEVRKVRCTVELGLVADLMEEVSVWRQLAERRGEDITKIEGQLDTRTKQLAERRDEVGKLHARIKTLEYDNQQLEKDRDARYEWADVARDLTSMLPNLVNTNGAPLPIEDFLQRLKLELDNDTPF